MKPFISIILFITCSLWQNISMAQTPTKKSPVNLFTIGFNGQSQHFIGNNFIAKTYSDGVAGSFDANVNVYKNVCFGVQYQSSLNNVYSTKYIGNSDKGYFSQFGFTASYIYKFSKYWALLPRFSIATLSIKNGFSNLNSSESYTYKTIGSITSFSPELHYFFFPSISIFTNIHYDLMSFDVKTSNEIGVNYHLADAFGIGLGARFWINR